MPKSLTPLWVVSSMPINITCRVSHWPRTWKLSMAGTATVGVMPSMSPPAARVISSMCHFGSWKPESEWLSNTRSERMPWIRVCISWEKPAITALTTIIVATPSITLATHTSAIQRVRRYRQQRRSLYMVALARGRGR